MRRLLVTPGLAIRRLGIGRSSSERARAATITARHGGDVATIALTDKPMSALDDAQYTSGQGPRLAVLDATGPVALEDATQADDRWEHFNRTAAELGIRSSLSLHLPTDSTELAGSLNLYSRPARVFGDDQIRAATRFAAQLATTLSTVEAHRSTTRLAQHLAEAMRSRATIEQAKGILMAEHHTNEVDAFAQRLVEERSKKP